MATSGRLRKRIVGALRGTEGSDVPSSTTMTIKSAPPRTAKMMTRMSIRHGYMNKRNEQAVWQRRYCVLVPHTFLYYFESEDAECPRGVIDLEYYTDISADDRHIVKLASQGGGLTRTFYFLPDGDLDTADWLAALNRERYFQVREERDEYRDLQNEFSSQIRANVDAVSAAFEEKEALQADLSQERTSSIAHQGQMKKLLLKLGLASQEAEAVMAADEHQHSSLVALQVIEKVFEEHEHKWKEAQKHKQQCLEEAQARQEAEVKQWHERLVAVESRAAEERRALQAQIDKEKDKGHVVECELQGVRDQLQLLEAQSTQSLMNVSVALAQQRTLEGKLHELGEHKKLLVKEVKSLRTNLDKSRAINRKLITACRAMDEHSSLRTRAQEENGPQEEVHTGEENPEGEGGEDCPSLAALQLREALEEAQSADHSYSAPSSSMVSEECPKDLPKPSLPPSAPLLASTASALLHVTTRSLSETFELLPSPPRRPLLSLGPGESPSTLHSTADHGPEPLPSPSSSPARSVDESLPSSVASADMLRGFGAKLRVLLHEVDSIDTFLFPNPPPAHLTRPPQAPSTPLPDPPAGSSSAFPPFPPKTDVRGMCPQEAETPVVDSIFISGCQSASVSSVAATPALDPSLEEPPPVQVQMCRRCNGSVEGPLLSTCRCLEPLLSPAPPLLPSASNLLSMLKAVRAPSIGDAYQSLSSLPSSSTLLRRLGHKDGGSTAAGHGDSAVGRVGQHGAEGGDGEGRDKPEERDPPDRQAAKEDSKGPTAEPGAQQDKVRPGDKGETGTRADVSVSI